MVKTNFKQQTKMKKLFLSLCVIAAVSFTACGGSAKTESTETVATETVAAPAEEASTENSAFDQYVAFVKKNAELAKQVKAGDMTAATESVKYAEEFAKFMEDNKDAIENFSEAQLAELAKIGEEIAADLAK